MKRNLYTTAIIAIALMVAGLTSCQKDDDLANDSTGSKTETVVEMVPRTVVIYMSSENNLGQKGFLSHNYDEIVSAAKSLPDNDHLLLYIDDYGKAPYIVQADKNGVSTVKTFDIDFYSSDPAKMEEILKWCYTQYPSTSYGLVLWGHGSGWLVSSAEYCITRSYGMDEGKDVADGSGTKWMNISDMASALSSVPHLDYIFSDCCNMQSVEVAYELHSCADYLIASPAEIPGYGAPYQYVLKDLFAEKTSVGKLVVDDYENHGYFYGASGLPMAVVKTSEMEQLATATEKALTKFMSDYTGEKDVPLDGMIYYQEESSIANYAPISYDMRDVMKYYLSDSDYDEWNNAFKKAVIYSVHPADIHTSGKADWAIDSRKNIDFNSFYLTDDNFGGISMFIPQTKYSNTTSDSYVNPNSAISTMAWGKKINWPQWGK